MKIDTPLVSFCVMCYNQVDLIVPALEAAFAQTYRPMEIVISDDCSTDGTADVIERMISEYRANGGDIPIVFLRQKTNQGNLGNWQRICEVARGELFIKADGDDISLPTRTEEVVGAWLAADKKPLIVYNGAIKINVKGKAFGICKKEWLSNVPVGTVSAYSRRLFDEFGGIIVRNPRAADDATYSGRAKILGGSLCFLDRILVRYRIGSGMTTGITRYRAVIARALMANLLAHEQLLEDVKTCRKNLTEDERACHVVRLNREMEHIRNVLSLWDGKSFTERLRGYRLMCRRGSSRGGRAIGLILLLPTWMCDPILNVAKLVKHFFDRVRFAGHA